MGIRLRTIGAGYLSGAFDKINVPGPLSTLIPANYIIENGRSGFSVPLIYREYKWDMSDASNPLNQAIDEVYDKAVLALEDSPIAETLLERQPWDMSDRIIWDRLVTQEIEAQLGNVANGNLLKYRTNITLGMPGDTINADSRPADMTAVARDFDTNGTTIENDCDGMSIHRAVLAQRIENHFLPERVAGQHEGGDLKFRAAYYTAYGFVGETNYFDDTTNEHQEAIAASNVPHTFVINDVIGGIYEATTGDYFMPTAHDNFSRYSRGQDVEGFAMGEIDQHLDLSIYPIAAQYQAITSATSHHHGNQPSRSYKPSDEGINIQNNVTRRWIELQDVVTQKVFAEYVKGMSGIMESIKEDLYESIKNLEALENFPLTLQLLEAKAGNVNISFDEDSQTVIREMMNSEEFLMFRENYKAYYQMSGKIHTDVKNLSPKIVPNDLNALVELVGLDSDNPVLNAMTANMIFTDIDAYFNGDDHSRLLNGVTNAIQSNIRGHVSSTSQTLNFSH